MIAKEVSWFDVFDRKILATVIFDRTDGDFGFVILGRDSRKIFRWIDGSAKFYPTQKEAELALEQHVVKYENDGKEVYPQGDESETPNEILVPVVEERKLHPYFRVLVNKARFEAARNLIKEIAYSYVDVDGHYVREFQTGGFDARLWELYLYVYLYNAGFEFFRETPAPDYHASFFGDECCLEAVTVNPGQRDPQPPKTKAEVEHLHRDYLPIKYGSTLYTKLKKKYWEKKHVEGKPLILAIHDFHMPGSMTWSRTALSEYLYGVRARVKKKQNGTRLVEMEEIANHSWEGKDIPSNFFAQPDTENISAVLFSNAATITKFNRMGKLAGLGSKDTKLIRIGYLYNPDPIALEPLHFAVDVDSPEYEESWSDGLIMYHNSNAKHPVNPEWFWDISHLWYDKEQGHYGRIQPYDVLSSVTLTISSAGQELIEEEQVNR
jgi:hypothetical protein